MASTLVTGAGGFAGGHLVEHLAATRDVVGWVRSAPPTHLSEIGSWDVVDLLDRARVRSAVGSLQPSVVFHCAGSPHVAGSWSDAATALSANVLATHHLLDALRRAGCHSRVLITGSAYVYKPTNRPLREDDPVAPQSPYGLSKWAQEALGLRAVVEDELDVVVARAFNHTGPRQSDRFAAPSFARQIAHIERGAAEPVIRVGNLEARRDLTDVRDVVKAYVALSTKGLPGTVYNVASGTARSIRWWLDQLLARARVPIGVVTDPERLRPHDVPLLVGDVSRLQELTDWRPTVSTDQMLDDLLAYWRARRDA